MTIRRKYLPFVTAVVMGLSIGVEMSFVLTWINLGFAEGFIIKWGKAFAVGVSVGIPTAIVVVPLVTKRLQKMVVD